MALQPSQYAALKAYIDSVPALAQQPNNEDGAFAIAAEMNKPASPAFIVWRTNVLQDTITQNGFDWTQVDGLSVGKARIWEWLFLNATRSMNPSKSNVRAGIIECWSGTAQRVAVQATVLGHCKRSATVAEKVFATGAGTDATPATMTFEGALTYSEVQAARNA